MAKLFTLGRGTAAAYAALEKNADKLYFLNDTGEIYFGETKYGGSIKYVTEVPTTGELNTLYVVNQGEGGIYAWNGTAIVSITKSYATEITADSTDDKAATAKAVYTYVTNAVNTATNGLAEKPTYDAETRTITIPVVGEDEDVVINLGKDLVVSSGTLVEGEGDEAGKKFIELTLTSGDKIKIDINDLVDIYTGGATNTAAVTVAADNTITVSVKVSTTEGNRLTVDENGLFVAKQTADEETLSGTEAIIPSSKAVKDYVDGAVEGAVTEANTYADGLVTIQDF